MIESVKSFKVGDKMFSTFEEAQVECLLTLITDNVPNVPEECFRISQFLVSNQAQVLDILRATPNSMRAPKASRKPRSDKGVPRKKTVCEMDSPGVTVEGSGKYASR